MKLERRRFVATTVLVAALLVPAGGTARSHAAPVNTAKPKIFGAAVEGQQLTATNGQWTGTRPFSFAYRWVRCDAGGGGANGAACTRIPGAAGATYFLRPADVGHRIRVRVTATNAEGSATATSDPTKVVRSTQAAGAPRNTRPPTISGTPQVGQTLTANAGVWVGAQPIALTYVWRRCDRTGGSCATISGATEKTYRLTSADEGTTLRVRVTARNSRGASSATSVPSGVVVKAEPPSGSTISINAVSLPNRLLVDRVVFNPQPLGSRRTFLARFHVSDSRSHSVMGALVFVIAIPFGTTSNPPEAATGPDGWVTFKMRPTKRVRFGHPGGIVMFVRARKAGERLIGGVSTRRLVQLSTR